MWFVLLLMFHEIHFSSTIVMYYTHKYTQLPQNHNMQQYTDKKKSSSSIYNYKRVIM